jgi:PAS domain S-box-containing protein
MGTSAAVEEHLDAVIANVPGAIYRCRLDDDWTMEFISDGIERLVGYPASDFIGSRLRSFASIIHPDDREQVQVSVIGAVRENRSFAPEYRIVRADGSTVWVLERGRASEAPGAEGQRWLDGMLFDITERKILEEELRRSLAQEASLHERLRLARDLHDAVGHALSIGTIQAGGARAVVHHDTVAAEEAIEVVEQSLRTALREMRAMVNELHGDQVQPGLPGATLRLDDLVASGRRAGLHVSFAVYGDERSLPAAVEVSLYRTVQECLTNCAKYAAGSSVSIVLEHGSDDVRLTVVDDGSGCAAATGTEQASGRGLDGIRRRATDLGGSFQAGPDPAGGFRVEVRYPA